MGGGARTSWIPPPILLTCGVLLHTPSIASCAQADDNVIKVAPKKSTADAPQVSRASPPLLSSENFLYFPSAAIDLLAKK